MPRSTRSRGSLAGHTSLNLHNKVANCVCNPSSTIASKCFAAPSGKSRWANLDSSKNSMGEPILNIAYMLGCTSCSASYTLVETTQLPIQLSACATSLSTAGHRCTGTSHTLYKYKVFARVIKPCNSSSALTLMTFPANT